MWGGSVRKRRTPGLEKGIQNAILDYLLQQPTIVTRVWQNSMRQVKGRKLSSRYRPLGLPDICGFLFNGRALFIEVKKPQKFKTSTEQIEFLEDCDRANALGFMAHSVEEVIERFKREGYLK